MGSFQVSAYSQGLSRYTLFVFIILIQVHRVTVVRIKRLAVLKLACKCASSIDVIWLQFCTNRQRYELKFKSNVFELECFHGVGDQKVKNLYIYNEKSLSFPFFLLSNSCSSNCPPWVVIITNLLLVLPEIFYTYSSQNRFIFFPSLNIFAAFFLCFFHLTVYHWGVFLPVYKVPSIKGFVEKKEPMLC